MNIERIQLNMKKIIITSRFNNAILINYIKYDNPIPK